MQTSYCKYVWTFSKLRTMIPNTFSLFYFNQTSLSKFASSHWCYKLSYQTCSYICAHTVHWITSTTVPMWAMSSLSERTGHRTSHYALVSGIAKIPVPYQGYATPQAPYLWRRDVRDFTLCEVTSVVFLCLWNKRKPALRRLLSETVCVMDFFGWVCASVLRA